MGGSLPSEWVAHFRRNTHLEGDAARAQVRDNTRLGQMAGVRGTPAFFINGFPVSGALPLEAFQDLLDLELSSLEAGG